MTKTLCKTVVSLALAVLVSGLAALAPSPAEAARCLFVSSYHQGYAWSDGVERGLRAELKGKCQIRQFDMDTKRKKSKADKQESAERAKALIEFWRPDIVITADDNAAKYLIKQYYRDDALPFVFCGVNWTVADYGFPYRNVTGMIEVAPVVPMLKRAMEAVPGARRTLYLGADTLTESKNLKRFREAAANLGLVLDHALVGSTEDWLAAYRDAQAYDFVILGSNAGVNDWDEATVRDGVLASARKLSVTNHGWMMPYAVLGFTKVPEEQGKWAAKAALSILEGLPPARIPIVANSLHDIWINPSVLEAADIGVPEELRRKAKKVRERERNS